MNNTQGFDLDELTALARLDIDEGRVEQALAKVKVILADEAASPEAIGMGARLYANLRLFNRARPLYEKYLSMRPGAIEEEFQLGMVQFDGGDAEQALQTWGSMLQREPVFPPALFYSAVVFSQQGKIAEARRNLDVLLQTAPADNLYFGRSKELLQAIEQQVAHRPTATIPGGYQA